MSSLQPPPANRMPFKFGERLGIFLIVESASLSAIAVSTLLSYVAYKSFGRYRAKVALRKWYTTAKFDSRTLESDASDSSFFICLMIAELVQSIGGLLNIKWIIDASVTEGPYCTAQGILKQVGDVSVAFMSLAIAIHTFCVLVMRWHLPAYASKYIIVGIFTSIAMMISISAATLNGKNGRGSYYGDTDLWCWIRPEYKVERIVFEYLWMWLAAFIMVIIYGIIAIVMRGILIIEEGEWRWNWNWASNKKPFRDRLNIDLVGLRDENEEERQSKAIANLMLFYPAVYIFCVFPVGLVRWLDFSGHYVPPAATVFASITFSISGLSNTILYVITRPELVIGRDTELVNIGTYEVGERGPSSGKSTLKRERSKYVQHHFGHLPDRDAGSSSSSMTRQRYNNEYTNDGNGGLGTADHYPDGLGPGHLHDTTSGNNLGQLPNINFVTSSCTNTHSTPTYIPSPDD